MVSFNKIDPKQFVSERMDSIIYFRKNVTVGMRPAIPGEEITTIMNDGHVETKNTAKEGQVVIKNPAGEQYLIDGKKFEDRYEYSKNPSVDDDGFVSYDAKGNPMKIIRLNQDENVEFIAPWGEVMRIQGGGVIVFNGPTDIYGIQPKEFAQTYKPCSQDGRLYSIEELSNINKDYASFITSEGSKSEYNFINPNIEKNVLQTLNNS